MAACPTENCLLSRERFCYAALFRFSQAFATAFHFLPKGHHMRQPSATVLSPDAAYPPLAVFASFLILFSSRPAQWRSFLPGLSYWLSWLFLVVTIIARSISAPRWTLVSYHKGPVGSSNNNIFQGCSSFVFQSLQLHCPGRGSCRYSDAQVSLGLECAGDVK